MGIVKMKVSIVRVQDQYQLESYLRRNTPWHLYALADLDDKIWPETKWFALSVDGEFRAVLLVLDKLEIPILYSIAEPYCTYTRELITSLLPQLPSHFYAHVAKGVLDNLPDVHFSKEGQFQKMVLTQIIRRPVESRVRRCNSFEDLYNFYLMSAYDEDDKDERFFARYMFDMGPYFCAYSDGRIVSAGGVHILSKQYGVAAIGNIATHPSYRGRGLARAVTAAVVDSLQGKFTHIGLNVKKTNLPAIRCYESLGFVPVLDFEEGLVQLAQP